MKNLKVTIILLVLCSCKTEKISKKESMICYVRSYDMTEQEICIDYENNFIFKDITALSDDIIIKDKLNSGSDTIIFSDRSKVVKLLRREDKIIVISGLDVQLLEFSKIVD